MRPNKRNSIVAAIFLILIFSFNNCGKGFQSINSTNLDLGSSAGPTPTPTATITATPTPPGPTPTPPPVDGYKTGTSVILNPAVPISDEQPPPFQFNQNLKNLIAQMPSNSWLQIPQVNTWPSQFMNSDFLWNTGIWAVSGPISVVTAWGGGAYGNGQFIVWGGGHNDYAGNEVYSFDLASLSWTRLTNPAFYTTTGSQCNGVCFTVDGSPTSVHSYDMLLWIPYLNQFWMGPGSPYSMGFGHTNGYGSNQSFLFHPIKKSWTKMIDVHGGYGGSAYDPITKNIIIFNGMSGVDVIDLKNNRELYYNASQLNGWMSDQVIAFDYFSRKLVMMGGSVVDMKSMNFSGGQLTETPVTLSSHVPPTELGRSTGLEFDPIHKKFYAWNGSQNVWILDPSSLVWTKLTPTGNSPVPGPKSTGVWGRWLYIAELGVFLGFDNPDYPPYVYKP